MPEIKRLPRSEVQRQLDLLEPLRRIHNLEIIQSGLAARAIESTALINFGSIHDEPGMGTTFYPFRFRLDSVPIPMLSAALREVHADPLSMPLDNIEKLEFMQKIVGNDTHPSYGLVLGRVDQDLRGSITAPYIVGLDLGEESSTALASDLVPFSGILEDDLILLRRQMTEIGVAVMQLQLDVIDPVTLADNEYIDVIDDLTP